MPFYAPYPPPTRTNPFQIPLSNELVKQGWEIKSFNWRIRNLIRYRRHVSILHFHWPESQWRSNKRLVSTIKAIWWILRVEFSKSLGYKLVWSAHNVLPHYSSWILLEQWMRRYILLRFDLIVGHARNSEQDLLDAFGTTGQHYILAVHGLYTGIYPTHESREETRTRLRLTSTDTAILLHGSQTIYKNTPQFLNAWYAGMHPGVRLILTGEISPKQVDMVMERDDIIFLPGRVSDEEMGNLLQACDFVAIPYQKITTSGLYFLALTFNKPVIAPDLTFFQAHTTNDTAILYNHKNPEIGIKDALQMVSSGWHSNYDELKNLSTHFDWKLSSHVIAKAYDDLYMHWRFYPHGHG